MGQSTGNGTEEDGANGTGAGAGASGGNGTGAGGGPEGGRGWSGNGKGRKTRSPVSVELPPVEPWPEPVDGKELLDALVRELNRFAVFPNWAAETFALWILHTFAFTLRELTTYIGIESPEKECGKSTVITVLSRLVNRAVVSSNISPSAFFRVIEELEPTLLIDEADTNLRGRDELTGILNAGYTRSTAYVWRICYDPAPVAEEEGEQGGAEGRGAASAGRPARYSCWCPKAIAAIGHLHPTLASRCILIRMHRKLEGEECERLKGLKATELQRKCARFVRDHAGEIASAEPAIPRGLTNRAADIWEPLLALADLAGGRWPELARQAAAGLNARAQAHSPIGSLLLDILMSFVLGEGDRLFSRTLVERLNGAGERPWMELRKGKGVTETWLAQQLRPYGVHSRTVRIGEQVAKGYMREDFQDVFKRYIPKSEVDALKAELAERARAEAGSEAASAAKPSEPTEPVAPQPPPGEPEKRTE